MSTARSLATLATVVASLAVIAGCGGPPNVFVPAGYGAPPDPGGRTLNAPNYDSVQHREMSVGNQFRSLCLLPGFNLGEPQNNAAIAHVGYMSYFGQVQHLSYFETLDGTSSGASDTGNPMWSGNTFTDRHLKAVTVNTSLVTPSIVVNPSSYDERVNILTNIAFNHPPGFDYPDPYSGWFPPWAGNDIGTQWYGIINRLPLMRHENVWLGHSQTSTLNNSSYRWSPISHSFFAANNPLDLVPTSWPPPGFPPPVAIPPVLPPDLVPGLYPGLANTGTLDSSAQAAVIQGVKNKADAAVNGNGDYRVLTYGKDAGIFRTISAWPTNRERNCGANGWAEGAFHWWNGGYTYDLDIDYPVFEPLRASAVSITGQPRVGVPCHLIFPTNADWTTLNVRLQPVRIPTDGSWPQAITDSNPPPVWVLYGNKGGPLANQPSSYFNAAPALGPGEVMVMTQGPSLGQYQVQFDGKTTAGERIRFGLDPSIPENDWAWDTDRN